jgi:5'-nucleotidase
MTLEGTPSIVTPSGVAGLDFADEAETANRYAAELLAQGVETIVVLLHEGGEQTDATDATDATDVNGCNDPTGPITSIVPQMDDAIDVVITGHTHQAYKCRIDGKVVTSASSVGRLVTDIDLRLDRPCSSPATASCSARSPTRWSAPRRPTSRGRPHRPASSHWATSSPTPSSPPRPTRVPSPRSDTQVASAPTWRR